MRDELCAKPVCEKACAVFASALFLLTRQVCLLFQFPFVLFLSKFSVRVAAVALNLVPSLACLAINFALLSHWARAFEDPALFEAAPVKGDSKMGGFGGEDGWNRGRSDATSGHGDVQGETTPTTLHRARWRTRFTAQRVRLKVSRTERAPAVECTTKITSK